LADAASQVRGVHFIRFVRHLDFKPAPELRHAATEQGGGVQILPGLLIMTQNVMTGAPTEISVGKQAVLLNRAAEG